MGNHRSRVLTIQVPKPRRKNHPITRVRRKPPPDSRIRQNRRSIYSYNLHGHTWAIDLVHAEAFPDVPPFVRLYLVEKRIAVADSIPQKFRRALCMFEVIKHTETGERSNPTLGAIVYTISLEPPIRRLALWNFLKTYIQQLKEYYDADKDSEDKYRQNLAEALRFLERRLPPNVTL